MASQYITAYTIHQRCSHSPWVDNRENLHSYWLSSLLLLAWVSLLHVTHSLSELLDLRKLFSLLTWRTVVQQLVSCPKSVIIHVCIIGHKHHPQAFVQWIKLYRNIPWCTTQFSRRHFITEAILNFHVITRASSITTTLQIIVWYCKLNTVSLFPYNLPATWLVKWIVSWIKGRGERTWCFIEDHICWAH